MTELSATAEPTTRSNATRPTIARASAPVPLSAYRRSAGPRNVSSTSMRPSVSATARPCLAKWKTSWSFRLRLRRSSRDRRRDGAFESPEDTLDRRDANAAARRSVDGSGSSDASKKLTRRLAVSVAPISRPDIAATADPTVRSARQARRDDESSSVDSRSKLIWLLRRPRRRARTTREWSALTCFATWRRARTAQTSRNVAQDAPIKYKICAAAK
mmetsp:Transcript_5511/g.17399  ORF Transcript_5511/g.17399 Transcript_5511/m.17399 type:complete len:216 (+) Transcript_5511:443-1090(+)